MRGPIEDFCDGSEGLLAGSVPNLQLQKRVFHFDAAGAEVDSDRHVVLHVEDILRESRQDARLSHAYRHRLTETLGSSGKQGENAFQPLTRGE